MLPFGLCDDHFVLVMAHLNDDKKLQAIKMLRDCAGLSLKDAKGVVDMMQEYHKKYIQDLEKDFLGDIINDTERMNNEIKMYFNRYESEADRLTTTLQNIYEYMPDDAKHLLAKNVRMDLLNALSESINNNIKRIFSEME